LAERPVDSSGEEVRMDYGHIRMDPDDAERIWRLAVATERRAEMSSWRFYDLHVNWSGPARNAPVSPLRLRKLASTNADHH
jgi:hypothetical protein